MTPPPPTFRNARGQFSPGILSSPGDLRSKLLHTEDHWLIPPWAPKPWRLSASRVRGIEHLFPPDAKPTVRVILWALAHGHAPATRPYPTCGQRRCVNPDHQELVMSLSHDVCYSFFTEAWAALSADRPFAVTLPSEGKAISYRFQLHKWRRDNMDALPDDYSLIKLQIIPLSLDEAIADFEQNGNPQPFALQAVMDQDDLEMTRALTAALGRRPQDPPSARDLLNSIQETTDEQD